MASGRGDQHTLLEVLKSLIGSHDCGCGVAKISRSKRCLDQEMLR